MFTESSLFIHHQCFSVSLPRRSLLFQFGKCVSCVLWSFKSPQVEEPGELINVKITVLKSVSTVFWWSKIMRSWITLELKNHMAGIYKSFSRKKNWLSGLVQDFSLTFWLLKLIQLIFIWWFLMKLCLT